MTEQSGNGHRVLIEPFGHNASSDGVTEMGNLTAVHGRRTVKLQHDAPHLFVAMPVGHKDREDKAICPKCGAAHHRQYSVPGVIPAEILMSFANLATPLGISVSFGIMKDGLPAKLREQLTHHALALGAHFIFYWDDDVVFESDTWYRMLVKMKKYPDIGAISGVYYTKARPCEPLIYKDAGCGSYWGASLDPEAEPEDIFAAGAGCLMVRADAIAKMEPPYWLDEYETSEDHSFRRISGHDFRFCQKIWNETGYRVTVDGSLQCHHLDVRTGLMFSRPADAPPPEKAQAMADGFVSKGSQSLRTKEELLEMIEAA